MSVLCQTAAVNTSASATQSAITASVDVDTCSDLIICHVKVSLCLLLQHRSDFTEISYAGVLLGQFIN